MEEQEAVQPVALVSQSEPAPSPKPVASKVLLEPTPAPQLVQPVPASSKAKELVKAEVPTHAFAKVKSRFVFGGWCGKPEPEPISLPEPEREPDVVASQHEPAWALNFEVSQAPPEPLKVDVPVAEAEAAWKGSAKKKPKKGKMGIC
jgi:hypothetical protein